MAGLHIGHDAHGFWFLSLEQDDGGLKLLAHQVPSRQLLLDKADELTAAMPFAGMAIFVDDEPAWIHAMDVERAPATAQYSRPEPRKASRQWK